MNDVYENIDNYNQNRKRKILIVFDDIIADIMTKKTFQSIIKELFIRCRKINICICHSVLFFCAKKRKIKFNALFNYEYQ